MRREIVGVTYTDKDPVEITLGICEKCENYVPFIRLVVPEDKKVFQCMTCKTKHEQHKPTQSRGIPGGRPSKPIEFYDCKGNDIL